jgi:hypothetical protein
MKSFFIFLSFYLSFFLSFFLSFDSFFLSRLFLYFLSFFKTRECAKTSNNRKPTHQNKKYRIMYTYTYNDRIYLYIEKRGGMALLLLTVLLRVTDYRLQLTAYSIVISFGASFCFATIDLSAFMNWTICGKLLIPGSDVDSHWMILVRESWNL